MAESTEDRIPPVALPAGSFDIQELLKALDRAVSVKDREQHPERIAKAIAETIVQPELLANLDAPAIPAGASLVEQTIDYGEGYEPVKRAVITFDPAEATSGADAVKMRYDERKEGKAVPAEDLIAPPASESTTSSPLVTAATERVAEEAGEAPSAKSK